MVAGVWDVDKQADESVRRGLLARIAGDQAGRTLLWSPLAIICGIWFYFQLPIEPGLAVLAVANGLFVLLLLTAKSRPAAVLIALVIGGFVLAKVRAEIVAAPTLKATTGQMRVDGIVTDRKQTGTNRLTLIVKPASIEGVAQTKLPRALRLSSFRKNGDPAIGSVVSFSARLTPLPSPVMPGGFDYGRQLWFEGIGGTGRITGEIKIAESGRSHWNSFGAMIAALRNGISERIGRALSGNRASIADALITGERGTIADDVNRSLQISGLAHILSISGLHMSLVAGGMFWFVRAVLAAFPSIALRRPIKKWAACAALAIGFVYMLLAGADIATQRSYIMIAIVFFAIIIDRPALSLRNLVLAALIILLLHPESALSASFQMSFMAVMGLAAFYEAWSEWRLKHGQEMRIESSLMRYLRKLVLVAVGAVLTTLIAGTLSSIPAAYHFGRLGLYGVLANGLALPIISLVVMPMALASVLLMPLGLETLPLSIMGKGIDLVLAISDWAASLPGASVTVPLQPAPVAIVAALGFVALCLVKGRARFAGIAIAALAPMFSFLQDRPDLLIERTAANIAVINDNGDLVPAEAKRGRFAVSRWLQAYGDGASPAEASARPAWSCDKRRCISNFKGRKIVYFREGEGNTPDCTGIDVLVAAYPLRGACRNVPLRIDRFDVWRNGAYAIYIEPDGVRVATARGESGERPWVTVPQPRRLAFQPGK